MSQVPAIVVGFGNVGRALVHELTSRPGLGIRIVAASSSRGSVLIRSRSDLEVLVGLAERGEKLEKHTSFTDGLDAVEAAKESGAALAFIALPPSYESGEPNETIYKSLADIGISIVTADKTVLARDFHGFMEYARSRGVGIGYRATVAAGTPAIDATRGLRGRSVEKIVAVLNATTNYILTLVERGYSYQEAIQKAIEAKLAEPDPRTDTHGWDPAAKLAILVSTLGAKVTVFDVRRTPLDKIPESRVSSARSRGFAVKYLAVADMISGDFRVEPSEVPVSSPLASVSGEYNAIEFHLERETITLMGPAGPAWRTARVMITDALELLEESCTSRTERK
jgi:homoserine dehydrogenase